MSTEKNDAEDKIGRAIKLNVIFFLQVLEETLGSCRNVDGALVDVIKRLNEPLIASRLVFKKLFIWLYALRGKVFGVFLLVHLARWTKFGSDHRAC